MSLMMLENAWSAVGDISGGGTVTFTNARATLCFVTYIGGNINADTLITLSTGADTTNRFVWQVNGTVDPGFEIAPGTGPGFRMIAASGAVSGNVVLTVASGTGRVHMLGYQL
jgi:hypothetical protein